MRVIIVGDTTVGKTSLLRFRIQFPEDKTEIMSSSGPCLVNEISMSQIVRSLNQIFVFALSSALSST